MFDIDHLWVLKQTSSPERTPKYYIEPGSTMLKFFTREIHATTFACQLKEPHEARSVLIAGYEKQDDGQEI